MLKTIQVVILTTALAVLSASASDQAALVRNVSVGDWIEYKSTTDMGAQVMKTTTRYIVTGRSETEVIVKCETKCEVGGTSQESSFESKFDLTAKPKPEPPMPALPLKVGVITFEKMAEGDETITAAGKEYKARWKTSTTSMKQFGEIFKTDTKTWTSDAIPITARLKNEFTSTNGISFKEELTAMGHDGK